MEEASEVKAASGGGNVGTMLRVAREKLDMSQEDIGQKTRVPMRFIRAIEDGRYDELPSGMYAVGFVKTYARAVNLDVDAIGELFRGEIGYVRGTQQTTEFLDEVDPARVPPRWLVIGAVLVALLLVGGYMLIRGRGATNTAVEQAAAGTGAPPATATADGNPEAQVSNPPAGPAAAPAPAGPVTLVATDTVWLRVYERNGPRLFEKQMAKGETWQVPATAIDPLILTGRPQSVEVRIGAQVMPPIGKPDVTAKDVSLKPDALRAQAAAAAAPAPGLAPGAGAPSASAAVPPAALAGATQGVSPSSPGTAPTR